MNASEPSFSINISPVEDQLLAYDNAVRKRALSAIERLSQRVRSQMVYACPESSFLHVECEDDFEITFEAFSDHFDALNISFAAAPPIERSGAFVVRRGNKVHALRIKDRHDGVGPASSTVRPHPIAQIGCREDDGQTLEGAFTPPPLADAFGLNHLWGALALDVHPSASDLAVYMDDRTSPDDLQSFEQGSDTQCLGPYGYDHLGPSCCWEARSRAPRVDRAHRAHVDFLIQLAVAVTVGVRCGVGRDGWPTGVVVDPTYPRSCAVPSEVECAARGEEVAPTRSDLRSSRPEAGAVTPQKDTGRLDPEAPMSELGLGWMTPIFRHGGCDPAASGKA